MTWTLLRKELRQHWLALLLVAAATMAGYAMLIAAGLLDGRTGSAFESLRVFVLVMGVLAALVLCHRLVVGEYQARTQMFLEALPVSRWRMVAVKYGLGLGVILLIVALALAMACALAHHHQVLTVRFVAILAARAFSAVWFAYGVCFLMGFLGRYRVALYIAACLALLFLGEQTDLQLRRFAPLVLLDERFPYESELFPWDALRTTWVLSGVCLVLAFVLGLTREGSVAALLAEKMSHREKVFMAALLVGLTCAIAILGEKKKKAPFDLHQAVTEQYQGVVVKVAAGEGENDPVARPLARRVASELAGVREYLGLERLPPVFITRRRDLDANRYERGELEKAEGVHVQANFEDKGWQEDHFLAWLLREVLIAASQERAKLESKAWVLDGFALFWTRRDHAAAPLARDQALALRALYGTENGFTPADLRGWLRFRERVGDDIAAGVAWSGLKTLAQRQGPDRARSFLRSVLGAKVSKDLRAVLRERAAPLERLLRDEAGITFQTYFAQWQEDLGRARQSLAGELAQLPRLRGEVLCVPLSAESRQVRYRLVLERWAGREARYSFLYHLLPAFDEEVDPKVVQREQNHYAQRPGGELPETYSRGDRLYSTFALEVPALGCQVISGWTRQEIR